MLKKYGLIMDRLGTLGQLDPSVNKTDRALMLCVLRPSVFDLAVWNSTPSNAPRGDRTQITQFVQTFPIMFQSFTAIGRPRELGDIALLSARKRNDIRCKY